MGYSDSSPRERWRDKPFHRLRPGALARLHFDLLSLVATKASDNPERKLGVCIAQQQAKVNARLAAAVQDHIVPVSRGITNQGR